MTTQIVDDDLAGLQRLRSARDAIRQQIAGTIVGQDEVVEQLLVCLFSRGHCILEGVPGLAKTLMIRTLAQCLSLKFSRIQFTPDLMPSDITGTEVMYEDRASGDRSFRFIHGPVFANVLLADEINRTPPKTQSALLEGMQERQVSIGGKRYALPDPFFVLATQNPIEQEGTYPLPEAQLDRFLMKILVRYPNADEERKIYRMSSTGTPVTPTPVLSGEEMLALQAIVHKVPVSDFCIDYVATLIRSSRPGDPHAPPFVKDWVMWGFGPRGGQSLIAAAQARAALDGRPEVEIADIKSMATAVLRHRLVLNYNAEGQGQTTESVILKLIDSIPLHGAAEKTHERIHRVLNPEVLAKIVPLGLRAQRVVEGAISGLHRSPLHGASVEFADYREYAPGDDLKRLDWRAFARSSRYYIKRYEEETNLRATLLVDASASMRYGRAAQRGEGGMTKFDYAATLAASIATLCIRQRDAVGLALFDTAERAWLRPSAAQSQLTKILAILEAAKPDRSTDLGLAISKVAAQINARGVAIIVSDLLCDLDALYQGLGRLQHQGHDILIFQVLDPEEIELPFNDSVLFRDIEGTEEIFAEPHGFRKAYKAAMEEFIGDVGKRCGLAGIDHLLLTTADNLGTALAKYLHRRQNTMAKHRGKMTTSLHEQTNTHPPLDDTPRGDA